MERGNGVATSQKIRRGVERAQFAQSRFRDKAFTLALIGAQAACEELVQRVPAQTLKNHLQRAAALYRQSALPAPNADWVVMQATLAKKLSPWKVECVAESLILWTLLRAGDHPATIHLGCRNILGKVEAHMWVELFAQPLLDLRNEATTWEVFDRAWAGPLD